MACLHGLLAAAAVATTAAWRSSSVKGSKAFLASQSNLRPDVVANSFASLADKWRSQARVFTECNASLDSSVVNDTASLAPCSGSPRAFEKSCSTVAGAVLKASDGEPAIVKEYMDEVCGEPKLTGWKSTGCRGFGKAILDAMTADVLSNRERVSAEAVCHGFWLKFLAQESELFEQERKEREEESKRKAAERAEAMKRAAEEAAKRAEEEAKAEEERRQKEEEARHEAEEKRAAEEEAAQQTAKESKAAAAQHLMEEARALANTSTLATQEANVSMSSPEEVLAASAKALAAGDLVPSRNQTARASNAESNGAAVPEVADVSSNVSTDTAEPNNSSVLIAADQETAANATESTFGNLTHQGLDDPAVTNATHDPSSNSTSGGSRAAGGNVTELGAAQANKTG